MSGPRILTLDIETSPNIAHVWSIWNVNVGLPQLREVATMLCFAAKWHDSKRTLYFSDFHDGHEAMVQAARDLLDEADIVVSYNGKKFDIPWLQQEIALAGLTPPSPFKQVDLCEVAKRKFRFPSNKLEHVARRFGLGGKVSHEGHELWVKVLANDPAAWGRMRRYNIGDVVLTEKLYDRLLPWISNHPHVALYGPDDGIDHCSRCGNTQLQRRGTATTALTTYPRYQCVGEKGCGGWSRGKSKIRSVEARAAL